MHTQTSPGAGNQPQARRARRTDLQRYIEATARCAALQSAVTHAAAENAQLRARLPGAGFEFCEVLG